LLPCPGAPGSGAGNARSGGSSSRRTSASPEANNPQFFLVFIKTNTPQFKVKTQKKLRFL
jgi:hypothetical protein